MKIPFNRLSAPGQIKNEIQKALQNGHWSGEGAWSKKVLDSLYPAFPESELLLTTSATQALEMSLKLCGLEPGDEVILPSFTFSSCANAILNAGARPVFARVLPGTLCIDPQSVERLKSPRVKAVMAVHYGGAAAELDALSTYCQHEGLILIEDAAQAIGSTHKGQSLGSIGTFGVISFHDTKNISSGEGGLLILNRSSEETIENARIAHQNGTDRIKFLQGQKDRYEWVGEGTSASPADLLMAVLYPQLSQIEDIAQIRRNITHLYENILNDIAPESVLSYTKTTEGSNGHLFFILFKQASIAREFMHEMIIQGIQVQTHYQPLHASPFGRQFRNDIQSTLSHTAIDDHLGKCVVRLPIFNTMTEEEIQYVCEGLKNALVNCHSSL